MSKLHDFTMACLVNPIKSGCEYRSYYSLSNEGLSKTSPTLLQTLHYSLLFLSVQIPPTIKITVTISNRAHKKYKT